jgi:putative DNA primase/helicase
MSTVTELDQTRQAKRLMELFPTSARCHGTFNTDPNTFERINGPRGVKIKPKYREVHEALTLARFEGHIAGTYPIVAALACDDGTTKVSAADIDIYDINVLELVSWIEDNDLPLYVCRTKSGGAHVYAFHQEPISIAMSEKVSRGIARALGHSDNDERIEVFPRTQRPKGNGSLPLPVEINLPFFGEKSHFLRPTGAEIDLETFLRGIKFLSPEQRDSLLSVKAQRETKPTSAGDGQRFAEAKLRRYVNELRNATSNGNHLLNKVAYLMGTMVARQWIERDSVYNQFDAAIAHWTNLKNHQKTLEHALYEGEQQPHADLIEEEAITEDGVALEFAERHANDLRFDHDAGKWYRWTGSHWLKERTPFAFAEARDLVRELAQGQKQRVRNITSKANFAGNVEKLARADRALVATNETWDRDKYLLGTPNGTVDLKTGELRDPDPLDFISKTTAVAPADTAECPLWMQFLCEVTQGNEELIQFLQMLCGYALTGEIREHTLVFIHGEGGTGKGTFLNTVARIMRDYAIEAAPDMFLASAFERHPTELADLSGARLVISSDTSTGRTWNDDRIKNLTGGDKIKARFMRQDFFEFYPQFLLLIIGNQPPSLRDVGTAMRRRLRLVPFMHRPDKPDKLLGEKLEAEWPGILRWMIEGCRFWLDAGEIKQPEVVERDTERYFADQDIFAQWFEFAVQRTRTDKPSLTDNELFSRWEHWATLSKAEVNDKRWMNGKLRGDPYNLVDRRSNGVNRFNGIEWRKETAGGGPGQGDLNIGGDTI